MAGSGKRAGITGISRFGPGCIGHVGKAQETRGLQMIGTSKIWMQ